MKGHTKTGWPLLCVFAKGTHWPELPISGEVLPLQPATSQ